MSGNGVVIGGKSRFEFPIATGSISELVRAENLKGV